MQLCRLTAAAAVFLVSILSPEVRAQAAPVPPKPPAALETIKRDELMQHATVLAADEMRGRLTGTKEQQLAADYIAAHFEGLGLEPLGDVDAKGKASWYQRYPVAVTSLSADSALTVGGDVISTGFATIPGRDRAGVQTKGTLVLLDPGGRKIDGLAGKVPLLCVKTTSGKGVDVMQQFGMTFSLMQRLGRTARNVEKAGSDVLIVGLLDDDAAVTSVLNSLAITSDKPSVAPRGKLGDLVQGDQMGAMTTAMLGGAKVSLVFAGSRATRSMLDKLGVDAESMHKWVFAGGEAVKSKRDVKANVALKFKTENVDAANVVAVLRGSDPTLKHEALVYSAHMDHVGMRLDGNAFNGADDNASGTAGLMAIAQAFARSEAPPKRSVVFLAVSGEELGLWGSAWYAEFPTWPRKEIIGNINTDMIGRGGPDAALGQVMLTPSYKHTQYSTMAQTAAEVAPLVGMELVANDKFYERSDHFNFVKKGIPAIFFCCAGEHEDYHQVTDHADRLDPEQMEKTARLAFWVGFTMANADARPARIGRHTDWFGEPVRKKQ